MRKTREDLLKQVACELNLDYKVVEEAIKLQWRFAQEAISLGDISHIRLPKIGTIKIKDYGKTQDYNKHDRPKQRHRTNKPKCV